MVLLSPHVRCVNRSPIPLPLDTGCAFPAKRMVFSMGRDHANPADECDRNLDPMRGKMVSDESPGEYQRQARSHKPQDRTLLMFAIARAERKCPDERYPYGEDAMCVLFGGQEMSADGGK